MARATITERVTVPRGISLSDLEAQSFSWGRANRRKTATDFYGRPDLSFRSKIVVTGVAEMQQKFRMLNLQISDLRATHLRAAVKVEYQARATVPIARGANAYWSRQGGKPPAGGLRRSIRSFATDAYGKVLAGGGLGAQNVSGQTRSMTGEFNKTIGASGQRYRTVGGSSFTSAKRFSPEGEGRAAMYAAGKGTVPYAGPIEFGWNTRPNPSKKWYGGPIRPNRFLWRAYQFKLREVRRVYEIDIVKMIKKSRLT